MNNLHFFYYVKDRVLHFRISDGRTGTEPNIFGELGETPSECLSRLKVQLGLPESCTFERGYQGELVNAIVSYNQPLGNRVFKALYADGTRSYLAEDYANYLAHENNITITYAGEQQ